jgi:hypothetical protein
MMKRQPRILDGPRSQSAISLLLIVTLAIMTFTPSWAQNTGIKPHTVTLKQGQVVEMKLAKRLDPRRAKVGDLVMLTLAKPLLAEGATILPAGWAVHARITDVQHAAKECQPGSIHWELDPLTMTDGTKIEIQPIADDIARSRLRDQVPHPTISPTSEKTTRKTGSSVGGLVKTIALGMVLVPLIILMFPLYVRSEGEDPCPGGKGREDSIWKGKAFYAQISNDVQRTVD